MREPWWQRWPDLFSLELTSLKQAGIRYSVDERALEAGFVRLDVYPGVNGTRLHLIAIYPDFYPYLRPEVLAPDLELPRHQHPVSQSLCLIGRSTANWRPDRTLAQHLQCQLPRLLAVVEAGDGADETLEDQQGEPYSEYYPYVGNAIVLVDSQWQIPSGINWGTLEIGVDFQGSGATGLQRLNAAVLRVTDGNRRTLAEADATIHRRFTRVIVAPWYLLPRPIPAQPGGGFGIPPEFATARFQPVGRASIDLLAMLFPEEVRHNTMGLGWVFVLRVKRPSLGVSGAHRYLVRAGRGGRADMKARIPEMRPLAGSTVAVFGLGALGAPSIIEMARAGIGAAHILDWDYVDPAAAVRWPLGLAAAGQLKTEAIADFLQKQYPYTRIRKWNHRLGSVRDIKQLGPSDLDVVNDMLQGVDLVYDATAELGIQHLLSDLCHEAGIPYICVSATEGAWGGLIVRLRPGRTAGCWLCLQYMIDDSSLTLAPADASGRLQPIGCADPTFTGSAFDLGEIWLGAVRLAVATLCGGIEGGYPDSDWDIARIALRDSDGRPIPPRWETFPLNRHPSCEACRRRAA